MLPRAPCPTPFPYTTLFRSSNSSTKKSSEIDPIVSTTAEFALSLRLVIRATRKHAILARVASLSSAFSNKCLLFPPRSEEQTSELQSLTNLVCRLLLENKHNAGFSPPLRAPTPSRDKWACATPTESLRSEARGLRRGQRSFRTPCAGGPELADALEQQS